MEEAVKIAVRWRPMQANDDKNGEIIVQKLAKNVSTVIKKNCCNANVHI